MEKPSKNAAFCVAEVTIKKGKRWLPPCFIAFIAHLAESARIDYSPSYYKADLVFTSIDLRVRGLGKVVAWSGASSLVAHQKTRFLAAKCAARNDMRGRKRSLHNPCITIRARARKCGGAEEPDLLVYHPTCRGFSIK